MVRSIGEQARDCCFWVRRPVASNAQGLTPATRARRLFVAFLAVMLASPTAEAALVISEVLYNEVATDMTGEWIEIFNTGSGAIDLSNHKIGDEETKNPPIGEMGGLWQFPAGATIPAGGVQIVAISAVRFNALYSFKPTYEVVDTDPLVPNLSHYLLWSNNPSKVISMNNAHDQALIIDGNDTLVDGVDWGATMFEFIVPTLSSGVLDGQSYMRIDATDTNTAADWQLGSPSSPGIVSNRGDLNGDGMIDLADYLTLFSNLHVNAFALTTQASYVLGDLTADLRVDGRDFVAFRTAYDDANGVGAFAAMLATVPEPTGAALAIVAMAACWFTRAAAARRSSMNSLPQSTRRSQRDDKRVVGSRP